jgi:NitT/TauT family transport system substrate-binding protein
MRLSAAELRRRLPGPTAGRPGRRSRRLTALSGLAAAALIAGCGPAGSAASVGHGQVITVAAVPGIDNVTLYLARQNGYFNQVGLDVRIVRYQSVDAAISAVNKGAADIAAADYGSIFSRQANSSGYRYKIIADAYDAASGVIQIMTMPNSPITSPAGLANKVIAMPNTELVSVPQSAPDSLALAAATSVLQSYNVNLTGITWMPMSPQQEVTDLVRGKVAAILATEPAIYLAQEKGAIELVDACSGPTSGLPLAGYFTTDSWARRHDSTVLAFRSAIEQAAASAAMPGPVQAVLPKYTGASAQEAALVTIGTYPLSTIPASVQRTADLMDTEGMIRRRLNVAAMIVSGRP